MNTNGRQNRKTLGVLKWTVLLTMFTFGFIAYLHAQETFWQKVNNVYQTIKIAFLLKPLSVNVSFSNVTVAAVFQAEAVESGEQAALHSDGRNPTPKVALLFLTKGSLPHEPLWRAFFEAASKLSLRHPPPSLDYLDSITGKDREKFDEINEASILSTTRKLSQTENRLNTTACPAEKRMMESEIERLMKVADDPSSVISGQSLFSVYSHPSANYQFPATSIFYETEVKDRLTTSKSWGKFILVAAELLLMEAALEDTNNKKLILLSESCIPLYPPEVIYAQLMSEQKSRMKSCGPKDQVNSNRFSDKMSGKYFHMSNWRKNSQWFALNRAHAEVLVNDTYFKNIFRQHCNGVPGPRICISDEHYIPSTLDAYGLGNQTDCSGMLTFSKLHHGPHPVTFGPSSIRPALLLALRHVKQCNTDEARTTAAALLDGLHRNGGCVSRNLTTFSISNETDVSRNWVTERGYRALQYQCALFARKFPANAVRGTLRASLSCKGGSLGHWC